MNGSDQPELFVDNLAREAYRRWQKKAEERELAREVRHNRRVIENGDPELDEAIAALEQGWKEGR